MWPGVVIVRPIKTVMAEEKEESAMDVAEMEARKADNMLKHHDEILSRPARTWMSTKEEKKAAARLSKQSHQGSRAGKGGHKGANGKWSSHGILPDGRDRARDCTPESGYMRSLTS